MRRLLLLTASCALALGCVNVLDDVETPGDGPVVFGRMVAFDGEKKLPSFDFWRNEGFRLTVLPDGAQTAYTYTPDAQGVFCWELSPGGYTIAGWHRGSGRNYTAGRIGLRFTVPKETKQPIYIGDLAFVLAREANLFQFRVDDNLSMSAGYGCGRQITDATTQLMKLDEPGSFRETLPICNEFWGIACSIDHAGVVPTSPRASTSFPRPSGVAPRLMWESVGDGRFTYDVIVYEVAQWTETGLDPQYFPGAIALYQENLSEPSVRLGLVTSLERDSRYFWSVRLRDGERVSTWSTHGHFFLYPTGLLIALTSANNQLFTFSTP